MTLFHSFGHPKDSGRFLANEFQHKIDKRGELELESGQRKGQEEDGKERQEVMN